MICRWFDITDNLDEVGVWHPLIDFGNLLKYEKTKVYGGVKPFRSWYIKNRPFVAGDAQDENLIAYWEEIQISFSCGFQFRNYPFDHHQCILEFVSRTSTTDVMNMKPHRIIYDNVLPRIMHSLADDPIILSNLSHRFEFEFKFLSTFEKTDAYNYTSSYVGIEIKMKRITLGELLSGYYYPMAAFASLSMISFLINPDVVSCNCYFH